MKIGVDLTKLNPGKQGINHYCEGLIRGLLSNSDVLLTIYLHNKNLKYFQRKFNNKKIQYIILENKESFIEKIIYIILISLFIFSKKILNLKSFNKFIIRLYKKNINFFNKSSKVIIEKNSEILICPILYMNNFNLNIKTILCIHDIQYTYLPENFSFINNSSKDLKLKTSVDSCTYLIAGSFFLKKQFHKYFNIDKNKIKVISEGVDLNKFKVKKYKNRCIKNIELPKKFIFYPAQFWSHKNHILILEAINKIKNKVINVVFCGAKKNWYSKITDYIKNKKIKNIYYLGVIEDRDLIKAYNLCSLVIVPTKEESSCMLLKESFATKNNLLASNTKVFMEYSKFFRFNLFNMNDKKDLQKKIIKNYFGIKKKKQIDYNFKKVKQYTWKNIAKKFIELKNNF
jgi:glycosyltransferase involved in cell wall biosynthesis